MTKICEDLVYYAGTATLHFGVRCRDVSAIVAFRSLGSKNGDEAAAQVFFYKEFSKQNSCLKLNDVKVVDLTKDEFENLENWHE